MNLTAQLTNDQLLQELDRRLNQNTDQLHTEEYARLTEELKRLSIQLQQSEKGKSQFLSNVRNEINNPLTSILGLAASIGGMSAGEKVKRMSSMIYDQAFTLDFQLRNIIVAAEIEMGEIKPMSSRIDITTLIEDQVNYLNSKISQSNVAVKLHQPEVLNFCTDPYLLQIICSNVIANAVEYSGRNKVVIVETEEKAGELCIEVRDFGNGIEAEKQKIIFDRFCQVEAGLTKSHPGHGLGLTIVYELVELLGGKIDLQSVKGQGTTITLQIPPLIQDQNSGFSSFGNEVFFIDEQEF